MLARRAHLARRRLWEGAVGAVGAREAGRGAAAFVVALVVLVGAEVRGEGVRGGEARGLVQRAVVGFDDAVLRAGLVEGEC